MSRNVIPITALFCLALTASGTAAARTCQTSSDTNCWSIYSGPNYSQVVVGATTQRVGMACATRAPQSSDFNGNLDCYAASGASGAGVMGRAGQQIQPNGPFVGSDPYRRIMSLAIDGSLDRVYIHALRSDGQMFVAATLWPLGANPAIYFYPAAPTPPLHLRSIAYVKGLGLTGITSNNYMYYIDGNNQWQLFSSDVAYIAGSSVTATNSALLGNDALATLLGPLTGGATPQPLPVPMPSPQGQTDFNVAYSWFGQLTPLAAGPTGLTAIQTGCSWAPSTGIPCIKNNWAYYFGSSVPVAWSGWQEVATAPLSYTPISIQDGTPVRNRVGELWVITYSEHLYSWTP
jgi:hypothetical protein